jgi:DNA-binding transcriptional ArsR family regulator
MSSIFPLRETVNQEDQGGPRLVDLDDEAADEVFEALAATTTREIFLALHDQPQTASDLADQTDTSVQNVQYHLDKLKDVELIESVDTWYSERGSEMDVYAPLDESLVVFAGNDKERSIRSIFNRLVGAGGLLAPTSLLVALLANRLTSESGSTSVTDSPSEDIDVQTVDPSAGTNGTSSSEAEIATEEQLSDAPPSGDAEIVIEENLTDGPVVVTDGGNATQLSNETAAASVDVFGLDPAVATGIAFFCGGLFILTALYLWYGTPE